jgi:hypothetical protein
LFFELIESIGLDYIKPNSYDDDLDGVIVGKTIAQTKNSEYVSIQTIQNAIKFVKDKLMSYEVDVEPEIYLNFEVH